MSTVTLASLLATQTEDDIQSTQLAVLSTAGFPVTSWEVTSVPRVLIKADARAIVGLANYIPAIAAGSYVSLAAGDWLTLRASSDWLLERNAATRAVRTLTLTDSSGGATAVTAGTVWAKTAEGLRYLLAEDGTIPASGSVQLRFNAEESGADYNAATTGWTLDTPIPGVTVTENGSVTTLGTDDESDDTLRTRCTTRWSTLGAGANDSAYTYWALNTPGVTEVTRVKVRESYPLPGQVSIYLAGSSGPVSTTDTNSAVTQTGSGPLVTVTGTPTIDVYGRVKVIAGGIVGAATFQYSLDGGATWSATITTAATYALTGTGLTLGFPAGTYVVGTTYAWTSTLSAVTKVQAYIDPPSHLGKAPNCVDVLVSSAAAYSLAPVGVVYVSSATYVPTVQAALGSTMTALAEATAVGATVYRTEFIERIMALPGVVNVTLATPAADVSLASNEVLTITSVASLTVSVVP